MRIDGVLGAFRAAVVRAMDRATLASLVVEVNDGIIATAGVVEGFAGAGLIGTPLVVAAMTSMVAGGIAVGGARYAEEAAVREGRLATIDYERHRLAQSPEEELAELRDLYVAKGLSPELAAQVAAELTAADALTAHVEAEYRLTTRDDPWQPAILGVAAGAAYALGAAVPLWAVLVMPNAWRAPVTFVAAIVALVLTSWLLAYLGHTNPVRIVRRAIGVALVAMLVSLFVGWLVQL